MDELPNAITNFGTIFYNALKEKMDEYNEKLNEMLEKINKQNNKQDKRFEKIERKIKIINKKLEEINKKLEKTNQEVSDFRELEQISTLEQSNVGINKVRQAIWHSIHLSFP